MPDEVDIVLRFCEEQWAQCRQSENQRATVTNFVITIAAGTLALMGANDFASSSLPLAVFLFFLGAYGALTSAKLYERWKFNRNRARSCYRRIDRLRPRAQLLQLRREADEAYRERLQPLRLHWLWLGLHIVVSLLGLLCVITILV